MHDKNKSPAIPWVKQHIATRLFVGTTIIFALVIVGQAVAIMRLFPLKKVEPIFIEFRQPGQNFVIVEKASGKIRSNQALISMFLRSYVSSRETVDKITEQARYSFVMAMSGDQVGRDFRRLYGNKSTSLYFQKGFKRGISIIRDDGLAPGIHQIEIETIDSIDGEQGETRNLWMVTLQYSFEDSRVSHDKRLVNPMGLYVQQYSLTKRDTKK